ncbi:hypothetical protein [Streptomyces sp. NPDC127084]
MRAAVHPAGFALPADSAVSGTSPGPVHTEDPRHFTTHESSKERQS